MAAPSLFLPLGIVLVRSAVLPRLFAYLAIGLAVLFSVLGAAFMLRLVLPNYVTAFAGVQALWWFAASIALSLAERPCRSRRHNLTSRKRKDVQGLAVEI